MSTNQSYRYRVTHSLSQESAQECINSNFSRFISSTESTFECHDFEALAHHVHRHLEFSDHIDSHLFKNDPSYDDIRAPFCSDVSDVQFLQYKKKEKLVYIILDSPFENEPLCFVVRDLHHLFYLLDEYCKTSDYVCTVGDKNEILYDLPYYCRVFNRHIYYCGDVECLNVTIQFNGEDARDGGIPSLLRCARRSHFSANLQAGTGLLLPQIMNDASLQSELEEACLLVTALVSSTSWISRSSILMLALKRVTPVLSISTLTEIVDFFGCIFSSVTMQSGVEPPQESDGMFSDKASSFWKKIAKSEFAQGLGKIIVALLSIVKYGVKGNFSYFLSSIARSGADAIFSSGDCILGLLTAMEIVATKCAQFYATGSWDTFFHSETTYALFEERYQKVKVDYVKMRRRAPEVNKHDVLKEIRSLLVEANSMVTAVRRLQIKDRATLDLFTIIIDLENMNNELSVKIDAQKPRETPLAFIVCGQSSVGKTYVMNMMHVHKERVRGRKEVSLEDIYVRNPEDAYWTNHDSTKSTIIVDDAANTRPTRVQGVDKTMNEVIFICNCIQAMPPYADLADKGKNPLNNDLVMFSTNVEDLNMPVYFECPLAIARRLPYKIEISVKHKYRKPGTQMLDSSRVPNEPFPDVWDFRITKCVVRPGDEDKMKQSFEYIPVDPEQPIFGMTTFLHWYTSTIREHFAGQQKMLSSVDSLSGCSYCDVCFQPHGHCVCMPVYEQGLITSIAVSVSVNIVSSVVIAFFIAAFKHILIRSVFRFARKAVTEGVHKTAVGTIVDVKDSVNMRMRRLGEAIREQHGISKEKLVLIAVITSGITGWVLLRKMTHQQMGTRPESKGERESCWKKDNYVLSTFDIPRQTSSLRHCPIDDQIKFVTKRLAHVKARIGKTDRAISSNMLCVRGNLYIGCMHTVPLSEEQLLKFTWAEHDGRGLTMNHEAMISSHKRKEIMTDLALYNVDDAQPRTSCEEIFMPRAFASKSYDGVLLTRNSDGSEKRNFVYGCVLEPCTYDGITYEAWRPARCDQKTEEGDCGSVLLLFTQSGPMIAGFHRLLFSNVFSYHVAITSCFRETLGDLSGTVAAGVFAIPQNTKSRYGELESLDSHSHVLYLEEGRADVFGSFRTWRSEPRSKMRKTVFYDDWKHLGIELDLAPAVMKGWEPDQRNLKKLVTNNIKANEIILDACADALVRHWEPALPMAREEIAIYDIKTALNGIPGLRFVDRMNFSSSAGFPYCRSKKEFIVARPTEDDPHNVEATNEILQEVETILEAYKQNFMSHPVFQYAKKDEMRPSKKVFDKNTRGIYGGPFAFTIVMRQLTLSMTRIMQLNPDIFNLCVGMEAQTAQWDELLMRLKRRGYSKWIAIDFTGFDTSYLTKVMKTAFRAVRTFMSQAGATEQHLNYFECMSYDVTYYMVNFMGTLMQMCGKNPSGHAWTVIINSIVNEIYMMYAFVILHPDFVEGAGYENYYNIAIQFHDKVVLATYGDDNFQSVSDDVPWYNHTAIRDAMKVFGVTVTMADKTAESRPYISEDEVTFLKRRFSFEPEFGKHVAPLEPESIYKSLCWNRESDIDTPEEVLASCVMSATYEWAWHGRERYDAEMKVLHGLCDKHGIKYTRFPFDYFVEQFKLNSEAFYEDMRKRGKRVGALQGADCEWDEFAVQWCAPQAQDMSLLHAFYLRVFVNSLSMMQIVYVLYRYTSRWTRDTMTRIAIFSIIFNVFIRILPFICYFLDPMIAIALWRSLSSRNLHRF